MHTQHLIGLKPYRLYVAVERFLTLSLVEALEAEDLGQDLKQENVQIIHERVGFISSFYLFNEKITLELQSK